MVLELFAFGSGSLALVAIILMVLTRVDIPQAPPKRNRRTDR